MHINNDDPKHLPFQIRKIGIHGLRTQFVCTERRGGGGHDDGPPDAAIIIAGMIRSQKAKTSGI